MCSNSVPREATNHESMPAGALGIGTVSFLHEIMVASR
jgi:hypothetical protein